MQETGKAFIRRGTDRRFATRWLVKSGVDIGSGADSLDLYRPLFPLMTDVRSWDRPDGDAMFMDGVPDGAYDFVHSSHCLEHLEDPVVALGHWIRICKPGGHIIVIVPDEDLYEQGIFPSQFNIDHKWTFTIAKPMSWSTRSVNVLDLLKRFTNVIEVMKVELLDAGFIYDAERSDQTLMPAAECGIEFVLRKRTPEEIRKRGRLPTNVNIVLRGE